MERQKTYLRYNLQLFAKEGAGGEKTEEATPKKLKDARSEGQVAKSMELVTACMLLGLFLILKVVIGSIGNNFLGLFKESYGNISKIEGEMFHSNMMYSYILYGLKKILLISFPFYLIAFIVAFVVNLVQVKWKPTSKTLKPKFNKLSPISGMKRLFGKDKIVELLKSVAKVLVLGYVVIDTLKDKWSFLFELYHISLNQAVALIGNLIINLGLKISMFFMIIAFLDFAYQKFKFKNDMKMTKQEVKDEYKNSEGDPQIKGKIRQKMREVSQRRMMQSLPEADVVITNPTHLAVAIKYDKEVSSAPVVIAKGADFLANKIKDKAREHKIEIVENKPLARMLYYNVEIGQEIPEELYQMVAEVLAYVYELQGKI